MVQKDICDGVAVSQQIISSKQTDFVATMTETHPPWSLSFAGLFWASLMSQLIDLTVEVVAGWS